MIHLFNLASTSNQGKKYLHHGQGNQARYIINFVFTLKWLTYSILKWQRSWWITVLNFQCTFNFCLVTNSMNHSQYMVLNVFPCSDTLQSANPGPLHLVQVALPLYSNSTANFLQDHCIEGTMELYRQKGTDWFDELVAKSQLKIWGRVVLVNVAAIRAKALRLPPPAQSSSIPGVSLGKWVSGNRWGQRGKQGSG